MYKRQEPICQAVDSAKADMTIFDSSGIEAFVTENNPCLLYTSTTESDVGSNGKPGDQ